MLLAMNTTATFDLYLPTDTKKDVKFTYRYHTAREMQQLHRILQHLQESSDDQQLSDALGGDPVDIFIKQAAHKLVSVRIGSRSMDKKEVLENLTEQELISLLFCIKINNVLNIEDKKKSESPSPIASEKSVMAAAPTTPTNASDGDSPSQPNINAQPAKAETENAQNAAGEAGCPWDDAQPFMPITITT